MNIAFIVPEFVTEVSGGGLATYINNISRLLAQNGHLVTIIVKSTINRSSLYSEGIYLEQVKIDLDTINQKIPGSIYRACSEQLNERLLYVHEYVRHIDIAQYSNWYALALYRTDIPTVVRISSDLPNCRAANTLTYSIKHKYGCSKMTDYLEEMALMNADGVFGPSKLIADIVEKRTGVPIEVIESPCEYRRKNENSELYEQQLKGKKYIMTYGNLNLLKGSKLIGDSIYKILQKNPSYLYVFAGNDNGWTDTAGYHISAVEYIKKKAKEYRNRVIYIGALEREKLYPIISGAELCIFPSRIDNLPNACLEAMGRGKLVIGTQEASFEQLIEDGKNGFLIERENKDALIEKINYVLRLDVEHKETISKNAKRRILQITPELVVDKMVGYYIKIMKRNNMVRDEEYYQLIQKKSKEMLEMIGDNK